MAKALNTGDALHASLSHLFCVDDDNSIRELKASLLCTPHANVLTPANGATSAPVGRSFRTGGAAGPSPAVYGVDFPNYVAANNANLSFFCAVNQYNSSNNGGASAYGVPMFGTDTAGRRVGVGMQLDAATGKVFHNNTNGIAALSGTLNTADDITSGVTSFGFTRTAGGVVKVYINGLVDSAYTGGIANTLTQFGAAWDTAEHSLIGGFAGYGWASFDYAYVCDWLGTILTDADMLRLHNSLTGADAFALISLPVDTTPPTLSSPTGTSTGSTTATGSVSTNEATGTLYRLASTNAVETAATVKAAALTQAVSATGSQAVSFTGLIPSTLYFPHYVHRDAAGNDSAVATGASFTTAVAGDTTAPVLTGAITINPGSVTTTGWQASCPAATDNSGSVTYDWSTDGGVTWPINWPVNNYTFVDYAAGTTYALRVRARDAAGNVSTPPISGSVTTLLPAVTTDPLEDENGAILASTLIAKVGAVKLSDMSMTATWVNQTTDASGALTLEHASLTAVTHIIVTSSTTGAAAGAKAYTPVV